MKFNSEALRIQMAKEDINNKELEEKTGLSRIYIGQWKKGEREPSLNQINIMAKKLKIKATELIIL